MNDARTVALHENPPRQLTHGSQFEQAFRRRIAELEQVYHLSASDALAYALAEAEAAATLAATPDR